MLDEWALVGVDGLGRGLSSRMGLGGVDLTGMGGSVERAIHTSFSVSGSGPATLQPNSSPTYALCNQFLPKVFSSVLQKHQYLSGSGSGPATMQPNQYPKYLQSQLNKLEKICLSSPQNTAMCFMILFVDLRPCDLDPG